MRKNVLVFPCGSEVGLEIYKSVCFSTHFKLYGGSSIDDHGQYIYQNYIPNLPFVDDPDFINKLNSVIEKHSIELIFPAHDSVVLALAQAKKEGLLKCDVVTSPLETCEVARSKAKTYQTFKGVIPTPKVFFSVDEVSESNLPVFLKPDVGQGSKGTQIARSIKDIKFYREKDPSLLILEYLPGKEYTIDCFTTKDGKLLFSEGRERKRISNGISVDSSPVSDSRFHEFAVKINDTLDFRGAWFYQVKRNKDGQLILMEVAPRVAGTMGLARARGANLALLSLFDAVGTEVSIKLNSYNMEIDRALENRYRHDIEYSHVYIDFDDLLLFDEKINPYIIAFLFQCLNKGVRLHLITKHKTDLHETLGKYKLDGFFEDIIWIKDESEKHLHIFEKDAIFIDDSFVERKKVQDKLGIPVFDSHMLESLIEKF